MLGFIDQVVQLPVSNLGTDLLESWKEAEVVVRGKKAAEAAICSDSVLHQVLLYSPTSAGEKSLAHIKSIKKNDINILKRLQHPI